MKQFIVITLALLIATSALSAADAKPLRVTFSLALVSVSAADVALTIHGTRYHGLVESNPLWRRSFETRNYTMPIVVQTLGTSLLVVVFNKMARSDDKTQRVVGWVLFSALIAFRTYLVMHNAALNARTPHVVR